jgi:hypothetical protein
LRFVVVVSPRNITLKQCVECKEYKDIGAFTIRNDTLRMRGACRQCESERMRVYYIKNGDKLRGLVNISGSLRCMKGERPSIVLLSIDRDGAKDPPHL